MNKPTIPNEVADAIEKLRAEPGAFTNETIIQIATPNSSEIYIGESVQAVRSIPFDTLLAALVNGYVRELTEEQRIHAEIARRYRTHRESPYPTDRSFANGIEYAVRALGIKIEGVNA